MAIQKVVIPTDLGPEFLIGTEIPNKITVGVLAPISKVGGKLTITPADLATMLSNPTVTDALVAAVLTDADFGPAVKAAETTTSISYSSATGVLTYIDEDGVSTAIDLPTENILSSPVYDAAANTLTFTKPDGSTVVINLTDLVDIYALSAGNGIAVTGNGSTATPWTIAVKPDPSANNLLTVGAAGVMVDKAAVAAAANAATTNTLASAVNTMTSTVNGIAATAPIVNTNVLAAGATAGTIKSTVNGVASADLNIGSVVRPLADVEVQDAFGNVLYYAFSTNV